MEIALLKNSSLRLKGKTAMLGVDASSRDEFNAIVLLSKKSEEVAANENGQIVIDGPGEYETGGIKTTGLKIDSDIAYSFVIDSVDVSLGNLSSLSKFQNKLKEANILVVNCDNTSDASFLTSLASNVIILYGEKSSEVEKGMGSENLKKLPKYAVTIDKLPAEVETVILS